MAEDLMEITRYLGLYATGHAHCSHVTGSCYPRQLLQHCLLQTSMRLTSIRDGRRALHSPEV